MNERIREVWIKAASEDFGETWDSQEQFIERFGKLIVRECANHCDLLLDHKISSEWSRGTHDCSRAIKQHFGVEK